MFPILWDVTYEEETIDFVKKNREKIYQHASHIVKVTFCDHYINTLTFMYLYDELFCETYSLLRYRKNLKAK